MMSFFISNAWAEAAPAAGQGSPLAGLLPLIILFAVFYFMLIRPQMKRAKEHRKLISELAKGDEVVTSGGIGGKITNVGDSFVTLEIGEDVQVKVQKDAVTTVLPKGTLKEA